MAVYTELSQSEIEAFLGSYEVPGLKAFEGIRAGVENTNYRITLADGCNYILTVFEKRVAESDLPFFTGLMECLSSNVPCPKPLRTKNGELIRRIKNKPAIMVSFLQGRSVSMIQNEHMEALGAHVARMHKGAQDYSIPRPNALSLEGWKALAAKIGTRANEIELGLAEELQKELNELELLWPHELPRGVIHADIFPDNIFYDDAARLTGIIDFYFACNDMLSYELAIILNAWCFEPTREFNITKAMLMLRSYHAVRPISEVELEALPVLARGAALRFLLTRAHDWLFPVEGALVTPKDPLEYLKKLRFHRAVKNHKEYGL